MNIGQDPDHSDGAPTIEGTGIRVKDIAVASEHGGYDPEDITQLYPDCSLGDVHRVLAYYDDKCRENGSPLTSPPLQRWVADGLFERYYP